MGKVNHPLRLAIVDDYPVVVAGVASFLAAERIDVVETGAMTPVITDVDIVLYDTFGQVQGVGIDLQDFVRDSRAKVVIYSWNLHGELVQDSLEAGVAGYLSKGLEAAELVDAIERIHAGERVLPIGGGTVSPKPESAWPGKEHGLTVREAEIIALITQGLSNQEIADRSYLSINSVKTYIRTAYRKIGVERRAQAVLWGIKNGFEPDIMRRVRR